MSRVLIITYDLTKPGRNYERLIAKIKAYNSWARLGGSSYLIYTNSSTAQVRDDLKTALDPNDKLYVGVSPAPSSWFGLPDNVAKWIHANQK